MLGRKKEAEDIFAREATLNQALQQAREQREQTTATLAALDGRYKEAASAALDSGDDSTALALRKQIEKLQVKRDGLDARIADLEPRVQEATQVAQAERLARIERERRERFAALVAEARDAGDCLRFSYEQLMLALSRFDDSREKLAAQEFGNEGLHELEVVGNAVFQAHPGGLQGTLLAAGWRQRTGGKVRPTYLEIVSLAAPPGG